MTHKRQPDDAGVLLRRVCCEQRGVGRGAASSADMTGAAPAASSRPNPKPAHPLPPPVPQFAALHRCAHTYPAPYSGYVTGTVSNAPLLQKNEQWQKVRVSIQAFGFKANPSFFSL
jgi:hypothetical protein